MNLPARVLPYVAPSVPVPANDNRIVNSSKVYHAQLNGSLKPKEMCSFEEYIDIMTYEPPYEKNDDYTISDLMNDEQNRGYYIERHKAFYDPNLEYQAFAPRNVIRSKEAGASRGHGVRAKTNEILTEELVALQYYKQCGTYKEAAAALGISLSTVHDRISRLRKKLTRIYGATIPSN